MFFNWTVGSYDYTFHVAFNVTRLWLVDMEVALESHI